MCSGDRRLLRRTEADREPVFFSKPFSGGNEGETSCATEEGAETEGDAG